MVRVGIIGVTGKMGRSIKNIIDRSKDLVFVGGINSSSSKDDWVEVFKNADIVIDFSNHGLINDIIEYCHKFKVYLVSGTTAFTDDEMAVMKSIKDEVGILHANNFCISIHLVANFIKTAKRLLGNYDISILETHHKEKKDAPSGTAIFLGNEVGVPSDKILSRRCGKVIGEHEISFYGEKDKLSFIHEAYDRSIFADGAINVSRWLMCQEPGFYSMEDFIKNV